MKIAVFSDSHGEITNMALAVRQSAPDMVVHLGDHSRDAHKLREMFPRIPFKIVRGNCDYNAADRDSDIFFCGDVKVLITHGHLHGVKRGLGSLYDAGISVQAKLVLYGHTHIRRCDITQAYDGSEMYVLNPGTAGYYGKSGWAVVEIASTISYRLLEFGR